MGANQRSGAMIQHILGFLTIYGRKTLRCWNCHWCRAQRWNVLPMKGIWAAKSSANEQPQEVVNTRKKWRESSRYSSPFSSWVDQACPTKPTIFTTGIPSHPSTSLFPTEILKKERNPERKKNTKRTKLDKLNQTNQYWFMGLAWLVASSLYPTAFNLLNRTTTRLSDSLSKSTIIQRLTLFRFEMI